MRLVFPFFLIALLGCASSTENRRDIASVEEKYLDLDLQKSDVQIFPVVASEDGLWYYFYLQLKNKSGGYIDCDPQDIVLKTTKGKTLEYKFEKLMTGRFYLTLEKTNDIDSSQIDFFIGTKALKEKFKLSQRIPDKAHTKVTLISNSRNKLTFEVRLADKTNRPVELLDKPEIIIDGMGNVEDVRKIKEGHWEFSVIYPDENQIMYLSVRAQGVYLQNVYRYQHVEK